MGRSRKIQSERAGRLADQKRTPRAYTLRPKIRKTLEDRFYQEFFQVLTHLETKRGHCASLNPPIFYVWLRNDQLSGEVKNRWKHKCLYMTGYGTMVICSAHNNNVSVLICYQKSYMHGVLMFQHYQIFFKQKSTSPAKFFSWGCFIFCFLTDWS